MPFPPPKTLFDVSPRRLSQCSHIDTDAQGACTFFSGAEKWHPNITRITFSYLESAYVHICMNLYMDFILNSTIILRHDLLNHFLTDNGFRVGEFFFCHLHDAQQTTLHYDFCGAVYFVTRSFSNRSGPPK